MGIENSKINSSHECDGDFLEHLRKNHPDIAKKFDNAEELSRVLAAHKDFHEQLYAAQDGEKSMARRAAGQLVNHWPIAAIFLFALFLRMLRVNFGLPYLYHHDETYIMHHAIEILNTGDFNPHYFRYPSLLIYLELLVSLFFFFRGISTGTLSSLNDIRYLWAWEITTPDLYIWGRCLIAVFGAASVVVVYLIGLKVFENKKAGIAGALFLAISEAYIHFSTSITVDIPTAFLILTSVLFSSMIIRSGKWSAYLAAGIFGGLAISTKYNAFWVVVPYLLACLLSSGDRKNAFIKSACGLAGFPLAFLLGTPYAIAEFATIVRDVGYQARLYGVLGHKGSTGEGNLLFFGRWIFFKAFGGPLIPCLAATGFVAAVMIKKKETLILLSFPTVYFLHMMTQKVSFERNMMPVLPFIALLAGLSVLFEARLSAEKPSWRVLPISIAILISVWPAIGAITKGLEVHNSRDTRTKAVEWMKENLPRGSKVAIASELHIFMPELSEAAFDAFEITQTQADRDSLRKLGINFFVGGEIKTDRLAAQPLEEYSRTVAQLERLKIFDGNFTYFKNPIENPTLVIYKI